MIFDANPTELHLSIIYVCTRYTYMRCGMEIIALNSSILKQISCNFSHLENNIRHLYPASVILYGDVLYYTFYTLSYVLPMSFNTSSHSMYRSIYIQIR